MKSARRMFIVSILGCLGLAACTQETPNVQTNAPAAQAAQGTPLYKQANAPVEKRVADLMSRMTQAEKIAQMEGFWNSSPQRQIADGSFFTSDYYKRQFPDGVGSIGPSQISIDEDVHYRNAVQKFLMEETRLGIPAMFHDEGCHGLMKPYATSFPNPLGLAGSWDPALIENVFDTVAREMRARGGHHSLTPILDVARDPRWGRIEETMGEDPYLNGVLGAAMVRGLQGSADGTVDRNHVLSTLKHFAGHGTPEGGLNRSPAIAGIRELREVHLAPFDYVIHHAHPAAVMASYNEIDGLPSHANRWLLQDVLRGEFGYTGMIVSDYDGIQFLQNVQHVAADRTQAAGLALNAGVVLELPTKFAFPNLPQAIEQGMVTQKQLDAAVSQILTWKFKLGLFENPYVDVAAAKNAVEEPSHDALTLKAAQESIVLLKNANQTLPLSTEKFKKIAVIGPNANVVRLGGYSGTPIKSSSILEGIRARVGSQAEVKFAQGCVLVKNEPPTAGERWRVNQVVMATDEENRPLIDDAAKLAAESDVVILAIGETESLCRESWGGNHLGDSTSLELPGSQSLLLNAVLAAGKPVVTYLMNGRPLAVNEVNERASAVLEGFYQGQETGQALASILFGDVSPSGKLTVSFPKSVGQLPVYYSRKAGAGRFVYQFADTTPLFSFGYGLSYATFKYANARVKDATIRPDGQTLVSVDVTNTSQREADEIVQLYVHKDVSSVTRPVELLKGFSRVHLAAGMTRTVEIPVTRESLAFWDAEMKYRVEPGTYSLQIGPSSTAGEKVSLTVAP